MRNKIFLLTEDLSFFYQINKGLNVLNIKFKILNDFKKIPDIPSILITTSKEKSKINDYNKEKVIVFSFREEENLKEFLMKILAAIKIGYKKDYNHLLFSIDPGTKHLGLAVFLDDFYLISHTFYNKEDLISKVFEYINYFEPKQNNNGNFNLTFKFGRGLFQLVQELSDEFFNRLSYKKSIKIYLIDEAKSSKIKLKHFSKHEISAVILAFRDGIEMNSNNYKHIFNKIKFKQLGKEDYKKELNTTNNNVSLKLEDIILKLIHSEMSLTDSLKLIKESQ
ncbi:MAG: hypothetical protein ACTSQP_02395 [Promethearchaeota archaeon]